MTKELLDYSGGAYGNMTARKFFVSRTGKGGGKKMIEEKKNGEGLTRKLGRNANKYIFRGLVSIGRNLVERKFSSKQKKIVDGARRQKAAQVGQHCWGD